MSVWHKKKISSAPFGKVHNNLRVPGLRFILSNSRHRCFEYIRYPYCYGTDDTTTAMGSGTFRICAKQKYNIIQRRRMSHSRAVYNIHICLNMIKLFTYGQISVCFHPISLFTRMFVFVSNTSGKAGRTNTVGKKTQCNNKIRIPDMRYLPIAIVRRWRVEKSGKKPQRSGTVIGWGVFEAAIYDYREWAVIHYCFSARISNICVHLWFVYRGQL